MVPLAFVPAVPCTLDELVVVCPAADPPELLCARAKGKLPNMRLRNIAIYFMFYLGSVFEMDLQPRRSRAGCKRTSAPSVRSQSRAKRTIQDQVRSSRSRPWRRR